MSRRVTLDGARVAACPECDEAAIRERAVGEPYSPYDEDDDQYACVNCGATFDEFRTRPSRSLRSPLNDELRAMDADEIGEGSA